MEERDVTEVRGAGSLTTNRIASNGGVKGSPARWFGLRWGLGAVTSDRAWNGFPLRLTLSDQPLDDGE